MMSEFKRVLAYTKALEISNEELLNITGGSAKLTVDTTHQLSGYLPGPTDMTTDQIWD